MQRANSIRLLGQPGVLLNTVLNLWRGILKSGVLRGRQVDAVLAEYGRHDLFVPPYVPTTPEEPGYTSTLSFHPSELP